MISWLCGRMSAGKERAWRSASSPQCEPICGVIELVNQVSKMSASPVKPPGWSRCSTLIEARAALVAHRIDGHGWSPRRRSGSRRSRARPSASSGYQTGNRHAEVTLAADAPVELQVLGPVAEAGVHEGGVPLDLLRPWRASGLLVEQAHEPLPCRHELERAVALLVELDAVLDGLGLAAAGRPRCRSRCRRDRAAARRSPCAPD